MGSSLRLLVACLLWLALSIGGLISLTHHDLRAARTVRPPATWPEGVGRASPPGRETLLLFLHPRCPCSRATLRELARIVARIEGPVELDILFMQPDGPGPSWGGGELEALAGAIPGARITRDPGAATAARFGVSASGHVLLYDEAGRLRFSGGLTPSRGHEGDSVGARSLVDRWRDPGGDVAESPVYGCSLRNGPNSLAQVDR